MNFLSLLVVFLCIYIFGNLGFHYFNKKKHEKFLLSLSVEDFKRIENLSIDIDVSSSKSIYNYQVNKADIILLDDHIFLLVKSKIFKIAQPILQISRIDNDEKFPYVWEEISYISKQEINQNLFIRGYAQRNSIKITYKIVIGFSQKDMDIIKEK